MWKQGVTGLAGSAVQSERPRELQRAGRGEAVRGETTELETEHDPPVAVLCPVLRDLQGSLDILAADEVRCSML